MSVPLIKAIIQKYYPTREDSNLQAKVDRRLDIIGKKIDDMINDKPRYWKEIVADIGTRWTNVQDMEYRQMPSYLLSISLPLNSKETEIAIRNRDLVLGISLLSEYYTIFYQEEYFFPLMRVSSDDYIPSYQFIFKELAGDDNERILKDFETVQQICDKHLTGYTLINHALLMNSYIDGILTAEGKLDVPSRNAFSYLFDDSWMTHKAYSIIS